jgi:hypothetical protein
MAAWMGYWLIVTTVVVGFGVANFSERATRLLARYPTIRSAGVLGKALGVTMSMHDFYREHRPFPFLYYVFYPVLLPIMLIVRPLARTELKIWSKALLVLLVALGLEVGLTYGSTYPPYLGVTDALKMTLSHAVFTLFLSVVCLMPVMTTAFTFSHAGRSPDLLNYPPAEVSG